MGEQWVVVSRQYPRIVGPTDGLHCKLSSHLAIHLLLSAYHAV